MKKLLYWVVAMAAACLLTGCKTVPPTAPQAASVSASAVLDDLRGAREMFQTARNTMAGMTPANLPQTLPKALAEQDAGLTRQDQAIPKAEKTITAAVATEKERDKANAKVAELEAGDSVRSFFKWAGAMLMTAGIVLAVVTAIWLKSANMYQLAGGIEVVGLLMLGIGVWFKTLVAVGAGLAVVLLIVGTWGLWKAYQAHIAADAAAAHATANAATITDVATIAADAHNENVAAISALTKKPAPFDARVAGAGP